MNIQMQTGGVLITLLLLYFYKRQGNIGLYMGKLFLTALYINIACLLLDILSIILIVHQDSFPRLLVEAECKTYLVSLVVNGYMALAYASADIHHLVKADRFIRGAGIAVAAVCILIFVLPIHIFYDGANIAYTYGMACYATYGGALILIMTTLAKIFLQGREMNPKRRSAIKLWLFIWIAAALLQFLNSKLLLVGFAGAMGMVILFFELENPEIFIDRSTGFFNSYAFVEYIRQRYQRGIDSRGLLVSLEHLHTRDIQPHVLEAGMTEIVQFLRQIPEVTIFKTDDKEFSLSFENTEALNRVRGIINSRFEGKWLEGRSDMEPIFLQPHYVLIPSGNVAKNGEELLQILRYFRTQCANSQESNFFVVDEKSVAGIREREEMLETLIQAIKDDRVEAFYQPIYSTHQKKFVSAEALARIRREDGSIIPPGLFIPIAEETGLVSKIGEIIFDQTCRFIKENEIGKYGIEYIEVNLSVVQCDNQSLAESYIRIMEQYQLPPRYINLEITESASILAKKTLLENMRKLLDYGVTFSLDDFGNGESNLNYIVDMPIQIVKFDRDMTQAYFENEKARFVVRAAMDMIHEMQLKVVSEGVETAEQLETLERLGIDYIQGYYFSKPIESGEFLAFVKAKNTVGS